MPVNHASRDAALKRLKCATPADIKGWLEMHLKAGQGETEKAILQVWCSDCTPEYHREQRIAGRCFRRANFKAGT
jgi:hypothetical protein